MLAIDVSDVVRRAWHGHVNEKRNEPESAAPTAIKAIARMLRGRQPTHVLCAGEGVGSVRASLCPAYKANRPPKPDGLILCESRVHAALASAGIAIERFAGLEADDVLAGAAMMLRQTHTRAFPMVIWTRDKDLLQVVSDKLRVVVWNGDAVVDEAAVVKKWGVPPLRLAELLAIAGDEGDNIPHVKGWGPGTAKKILGGTSMFLSDMLGPDGYWFVPERYRATFRDNRHVIAMAYDLVLLRDYQCWGKLSLDSMEVPPLYVADCLMDGAASLEENADGR